jgi:hypothetical protein
MKEELKDKIIGNLIKSFDIKEGGFSSRKLTAFIVVAMVVITHIKWLTLGNLSQLEMVLTIDYSFIAALFGMTTYHSIKNKNPKEIPPKQEPTIEEIPDEPSEQK